MSKWIQAKNVHAGESINTTNGVRKVLRSSRRGESQEVVVMDACGPSTIFYRRDQMVERLGFCASTNAKQRTR